jgi:dihydroxyacetone kinase DhaKLM complex PTS-EIIA-like component DhaM
MEINDGEIVIDGQAQGWYIEQGAAGIEVVDDLDRKLVYGSPKAVADWIAAKQLKKSGADIKMDIEDVPERPQNHGKKWTEEENTLAFSMLDSGKTFAEVAFALLRSERAIRVRVIDAVIRAGEGGAAIAEKYGITADECAEEMTRREERAKNIAEKKKQRDAARAAAKAAQPPKPAPKPRDDLRKSSVVKPQKKSLRQRRQKSPEVDLVAKLASLQKEMAAIQATLDAKKQ